MPEKLPDLMILHYGPNALRKLDESVKLTIRPVKLFQTTNYSNFL